MSGFLFNGCGVADKFKKVKPLGKHVCPNCGWESEFHLETVKRKIHLMYIPLISYRNSYAVMCSHCKEGKYVTEQWAHTLLTRTGEGPIFETIAPAAEALEPLEYKVG